MLEFRLSHVGHQLSHRIPSIEKKRVVPVPLAYHIRVVAGSAVSQCSRAVLRSGYGASVNCCCCCCCWRPCLLLVRIP